MIKTVIFRLESVILSSEILKFKLYVILWYYLKRDAFWKDFDQLMELREQFIEEYKIINPLNTIAKRYLSDRDYERFKQEIKLYIQKYSSYYIKIIPGINQTIRTINYYYQTILFSEDKNIFERGLKKFWVDNYFKFSLYKDRNIPIVDFLKSILNKSRSKSSETIIVSNQLHNDLIPANELGLYTIRVKYDIPTQGILPQGIMERKYFDSIKRQESEKQYFLTRVSRIEKIAERPKDIHKIIQEIEGKGEHSLDSEKQPNEKEFSLWNLTKDILLPPLEEEET